jgi:hypothetical protein
MLPALFALVVLDIGFQFCLGWPGIQFFYLMLPAIAGMTHRYTQLFSVEMESCNLFFAQADLKL